MNHFDDNEGVLTRALSSYTGGDRNRMNLNEYIKRGMAWIKKKHPEWLKDDVTSELFHHGIKGQKWGVRNGPPYPLDHNKETVEKTEKSGIVRKTVSGHSSNPPRGVPNSISDHIGRDGKVDKRAFYDENGMKGMELHTTDHGNPKEHPYGKNGEHIHYYEWDDNGRMVKKEVKDLTDEQREENDDIL